MNASPTQTEQPATKPAHTPTPHEIKPSAIGMAHVDHAIGRLRHALLDSRNHPSAYPILARYGEMEQTPSGFVAIDPHVVIERCKRVLVMLETAKHGVETAKAQA